MYALPIQFGTNPQISTRNSTQRNDLMFAIVRRTGSIKSHQRRDCLRYPCVLPVSTRCLNTDKQSADDEQQTAEGQMINFSDGGTSLAKYNTSLLPMRIPQRVKKSTLPLIWD